jgi:hypothetical protein
MAAVSTVILTVSTEYNFNTEAGGLSTPKTKLGQPAILTQFANIIFILEEIIYTMLKVMKIRIIYFTL